MLRTFFLLLALLVLIAIVLVMTGLVNLNRDNDGSLSVSTSDVEVGTTTTNVQLPAVRMEDRKVEVPALVIQGEDKAEAPALAPANPAPATAEPANKQ